MQYLAIGMAFTNENPELFEEGFSWQPTSPDLIFAVVCYERYLKDRVLQKSPHIVPEVRMIMQSEIKEVISLTLCVGMHTNNSAEQLIDIHTPPQETKFLRLTSWCVAAE
jgi:hypothetical protein